MDNFFRNNHIQLVSVRVRVLPDGRMTRQDAATYLGLKPKTLAMWAMEGRGPKSVRVGGRCFYFKADLDTFIEAGRRDTTSDPGCEAA